MITTTLEQSKRLKELGAPQDTELCWFHHVDKENETDYELGFMDYKKNWSIDIAAYTLSELIDWILQGFEGNFCLDTQDNHSEWYATIMPYDSKAICGDTSKSPLDACFALAVALKLPTHEATNPKV